MNEIGQFLKNNYDRIILRIMKEYDLPKSIKKDCKSFWNKDIYLYNLDYITLYYIPEFSNKILYNLPFLVVYIRFKSVIINMIQTMLIESANDNNIVPIFIQNYNLYNKTQFSTIEETIDHALRISYYNYRFRFIYSFLNFSFYWDSTPQGGDFWEKIYNNLLQYSNIKINPR